ncbi:hypothetical protein KY338_03400 [Candidatus Woesearchaeota archaeon]|nr:hypothetical protein [Candidatus Woesearchaeota archaeon]MBW3005351.1 hypothetical protein [Candidatus Woesearchaeota archaeon]
MRAIATAGIIAWSFFLTVPFIGRQIYRENFKKQECVVESKEIVPDESVLEKTVSDVKISLPWKKYSNVVDCCSGISPFRGICFFMKDDTRVIYKFDAVSEKYLDKSLEVLQIWASDDLYSMYRHIDKNKNRIIEASEAKGLYASLSGQR